MLLFFINQLKWFSILWFFTEKQLKIQKQRGRSFLLKNRALLSKWCLRTILIQNNQNKINCDVTAYKIINIFLHFINVGSNVFKKIISRKTHIVLYRYNNKVMHRLTLHRVLKTAVFLFKQTNTLINIKQNIFVKDIFEPYC